MEKNALVYFFFCFSLDMLLMLVSRPGVNQTMGN